MTKTLIDIYNARVSAGLLSPDAAQTAVTGKAGQKNADVCYGCHGGRSWYRIGYAYPRHSWEGMSPEVPDWAKNRPTESEARFALPASTQQKN